MSFDPALFVLAISALLIVDWACYAAARYPERCVWYYRNVPLGGIAALIILGRHKERY